MKDPELNTLYTKWLSYIYRAPTCAMKLLKELCPKKELIMPCTLQQKRDRNPVVIKRFSPLARSSSKVSVCNYFVLLLL